MKKNTNRQFTLAKRPQGMPDKSNFKLVESEIPDPGDLEILVETQYVSVDPYMRGRMSDRKSYAAAFEIGDVIKGGAVGKVLESNSPLFSRGDYVLGMTGWQEFAVAGEKEVKKIDPEVAPVSTALGVLGMTGLTAYFGLTHIGKPVKGETVLISGAAGAVGNVVGQIARIKGCRVVGITGSDEKVKILKHKFGFDAAVNYKTSGNLREELQAACPDGVDIYYDNVGGEISDAALSLINDHARIPVCGQISLYNATEMPTGPRVQQYLLSHAALMQGFLVRNYSEHFSEGLSQLVQWYREGRIKSVENIIDGFENIPSAFLGLFKGENIGKQLVKLV